jgi:hypothetical protein
MVSAKALMLLCWSRAFRGCWERLFSTEVLVDFASDVPLEAPPDFARRLAFGGSALDIFAGRRMVAHANQGDAVQSRIRPPVATAVEPVTVGLAT